MLRQLAAALFYVYVNTLTTMINVVLDIWWTMKIFQYSVINIGLISSDCCRKSVKFGTLPLDGWYILYSEAPDLARLAVPNAPVVECKCTNRHIVLLLHTF